MVTKIFSAAMRALLVWVLIVTPTLVLTGAAGDNSPLVVFIAVLAAFFTFVEYYSDYPSIVEFRFAAPFNRHRFVTIFAIVFLLSLVCKGIFEPTSLTLYVRHWGDLLGQSIDVPYSPVRLVVLMLNENASIELVETVRTAAGLSYSISLLSLVVFVLLVRVAKWPSKSGAFNVWVNLPLFDPTGGGDVLVRLKRDANINIIFGFLLPFLIPAVVKTATDLVGNLSMDDPHTLIWTMTAWAFLPASMIMRGIAMGRIAEMIEEKRRRAYAQSEAQHA
ncbi:hypothetical protein [Planktotalea sp.]|uniref:hypothetical protein n=1 Tax=Planktotalea sp. TaxID=2029877 RepID=UPI003299F74C